MNQTTLKNKEEISRLDAYFIRPSAYLQKVRKTGKDLKVLSPNDEKRLALLFTESFYEKTKYLWQIIGATLICFTLIGILNLAIWLTNLDYAYNQAGNYARRERVSQIAAAYGYTYTQIGSGPEYFGKTKDDVSISIKRDHEICEITLPESVIEKPNSQAGQSGGIAAQWSEIMIKEANRRTTEELINEARTLICGENSRPRIKVK